MDSLVSQHESPFKPLTQFPNNRRRVILILLHFSMAHVTSCEVSRLHTHTHTYRERERERGSRTPLNEWSARRRGRYLHNTHNSQETNIHFLSGIRTRDPSSKAAADLRRRPHSHPDRRYSAQKIYFVSYNLAAHAYRNRTSASYSCSLVTLMQEPWRKLNSD